MLTRAIRQHLCATFFNIRGFPSSEISVRPLELPRNLTKNLTE